jgi:hypothetical protein
LSTIIPPGFCHLDHLVFGDPNRSPVIARGYAAEYPDTANADVELLCNLEGDLLHMVNNLAPGERMQAHLYTTVADLAPLQRYHGKTVAAKPPPFCRETRNEYFAYYFQRAEEERLIQTNARMYLSYQVPEAFKKQKGSARSFDHVFEVVRRSFEHRETEYNAMLKRYGGSFKGLDNLGHYREFLSFWSPGTARHAKVNPDQIDWLSTLESLCRCSDPSPGNAAHGFYMDGHYFGVIALKAFPGGTRMTTLLPLTTLAMPGVRVVINAEPTSVEEEKARQNKKYRQLAGNIKADHPDAEVEVGVEKPKNLVRRILEGKDKPFKLQVIVIVNDRSRDELDRKLEAVRVAVSRMECQPFQPALVTAALGYFNAATPGYPFSPYRDYHQGIFDRNLVHMLPASSTPKGDLEDASWLADGDLNQVVGFKNFTGSQPNDTLVIGPKGSAKSSTMQYILTQSALDYSFVAIIDDGLSYTAAARKLDPRCEPIVVQPDGNLTFNLFDTDGLPRTPQQLTDAVAFAFLLVGNTGSPFDDKLLQALLAETIQEVYDRSYDDWKIENPLEHYKLLKEALTLIRFRNARMSEGDALYDVFTEARDLRRDDPQALREFEYGVTEMAMKALEHNPETLELVRSLACASWTPEMFPTLYHLYDELRSKSASDKRYAREYGTMSKSLQQWVQRENGGTEKYGPLVDGTTNVSLGDPCMRKGDSLRIVYFELGKLTQSSKELRDIVGFLITCKVRRHIEMMPRALRKMVIFEELTSILRLPNGPEMVIDYAERSRKYSCQNWFIFQQWESVYSKYPDEATAMMGGCLALLLLKNSRHDLEAISAYKRAKLPDAVIDRITRFPYPEDLKGLPDAHSCFCYVKLTGAEPVCTIGRIYLSQNLEKSFTTSGDEFEARELAIKKKGSKIIEIEQAA